MSAANTIETPRPVFLPPKSPWTTVAGAASYTCRSEKSIRRLIEAGKLLAYRPSGTRGKILVNVAELDALIVASTR
jgi:excisionase family DNA binding protein